MATPETKEAPKKPQRFHKDVDGQMRKIIDTYFDPQRNAVFDIYEVERVIRDSEKKPVKVLTLRRAASQDKSLQDRYRVSESKTRVEVQEVKIDG